MCDNMTFSLVGERCLGIISQINCLEIMIIICVVSLVFFIITFKMSSRLFALATKQREITTILLLIFIQINLSNLFKTIISV